MKAALLLLVKNFGAAFVSRHMIIWGLKLTARYTDNKVDDHVVALVEAAYENNIPAIKSSIEGIAENVDMMVRDKIKSDTSLDTSKSSLAMQIPTKDTLY